MPLSSCKYEQCSYNNYIVQEAIMGYSIHFKADNEPDKTRKVLKLQLGKKHIDIENSIKNTCSEQLRKMLEVENYMQLKKEAKDKRVSINSYALDKVRSALTISKPSLCNGLEGTYRGDTDDFFHHLFPYLEAFSPNFVNSVKKRYAPNATVLLDPFGGLGTAPFTFSDTENVAFYCEVNPLMQHISHLKSKLKKSSIRSRREVIKEIKRIKDTLHVDVMGYIENSNIKEYYFDSFKGSVFFQPDTLSQLLKLRTFLDKLYCTNELLSICLELSILASIVPASDMQRAGDLRRKRENERKKISANIFEHIVEKLSYFENGLLSFDEETSAPLLIAEDARKLSYIPSVQADLVITSPPYLNGTNYFRNTKLELWFIGVIKSKNDLGRLRDKAITAGINDVRGTRSKTNPDGFDYESFASCLKELEVCAYDKRIPQMIKWYAHDLNLALNGAVSHLKNNAIIAVDIGDSVYCDVVVPTDILVEEILVKQGCELVESRVVRRRKSRSGVDVKQVCVIAKKKDLTANKTLTSRASKISWKPKWNQFKEQLPHTQKPFSSRSWGHVNHSMCSYQGKLKPAIGKFLVEAFVPEGGSVLDPFSGVGTIPFEAALTGRKSYGFDISPAALAISKSKVWKPEKLEIEGRVKELESYINENTANCTPEEMWLPNFNKHLAEYYHEDTLREIIVAREWFQSKEPWDTASSMLLACCMHVLHGNRPYALSRRSHPVTPFAPTGEVVYKSLIEKLSQKLHKTVNAEYPDSFIEGNIYFQDAIETWPLEVDELDAIVTSPPFFDSTRFHLANWIRLWFSGWDQLDFNVEQKRFVDEKQKVSFDCYEPILRQAKERLKANGVLVLHLGKSKKCDMAKELAQLSKRWFSKYEIFNESVAHCESHGIRDKGTVTDHQYLVLY